MPVGAIGRRSALGLLAGGALAPRFARGQQAGKTYRVAIAGNAFESLDEMGEGRHPSYTALVQELRRLGWVEGKNLKFDRWPLGSRMVAEYAPIAKQIAGAEPDAIVAAGRLPALALKTATATIPIVFVATTPVESGLARSLARPGGNATGVSQDPSPEFLHMRLQLLKEITSGATRFGFIGRGETLAEQMDRQVAASKALGVRLSGIEIADAPSEIGLRTALSQAADMRVQALLVSAPQLTSPRLAGLIAELAFQARMPVMSLQREHVAAGMLMSYDASAAGLYRLAAGTLDRVLRGAKPAELAIEMPAQFECAVVRLTARALGIVVPRSMLGHITDYIE
jgi:putative tryptophan/tyrosine transport system substrate-binding protein